MHRLLSYSHVVADDADVISYHCHLISTKILTPNSDTK